MKNHHLRTDSPDVRSKHVRCLTIARGVMMLPARIVPTRKLAFAGLSLVVWTSAIGCGGPSTEGDDVAAKVAEPPPPPPERSYDNPNVPLTETEMQEIFGFCEATVTCVRERCDADAIARRYGAVAVKSTWGKKLQKLFQGYPLESNGRRLAQLVEQEGLDHKNAACREVVARFD